MLRPTPRVFIFFSFEGSYMYPSIFSRSSWHLMLSYIPEGSGNISKKILGLITVVTWVFIVLGFIWRKWSLLFNRSIKVKIIYIGHLKFTIKLNCLKEDFIEVFRLVVLSKS